ncbi:hypothetical protein [Promicromonospora iranensis]|uniref:Uncharacterized protein n=1 Tax=Promicromonospora iranensis TaxID=1105144 RepID=A0ABU2CK43_9MICO|nr:hypothetical protein [Promicromonospora iranensis]MDR7381690.1 hypothetical protein [Promicromonospora iranensis]
MTIERKTGHRIATALVAMGATVGMAGALAAPAAAADRTAGRFDLVAEVECDVFGQVTDVEVRVHSHGDGEDGELPEGDWLTFTATSGPSMDVAVEPGTSCGPLDVEFMPMTLDPSSTGGTVTATGATRSFSSSKVGASGSLILDGDGREALDWSFTSVGTYLLAFEVSVNGDLPVVSEALPLKNLS